MCCEDKSRVLLSCMRLSCTMSTDDEGLRACVGVGLSHSRICVFAISELWERTGLKGCVGDACNKESVGDVLSR